MSLVNPPVPWTLVPLIAYGVLGTLLWFLAFLRSAKDPATGSTNRRVATGALAAVFIGGFAQVILHDGQDTWAALVIFIGLLALTLLAFPRGSSGR